MVGQEQTRTIGSNNTLDKDTHICLSLLPFRLLWRVWRTHTALRSKIGHKNTTGRSLYICNTKYQKHTISVNDAQPQVCDNLGPYVSQSF